MLVLPKSHSSPEGVARIATAQGTGSCVLAPDARRIVDHDGLRMALHRAVFIAAGGLLSPQQYLLQDCQTTGCLQPEHFTVSSTPFRGMSRCRNGHKYTEEDRLPSGRMQCHICRSRRIARRPKSGGPSSAEINAAKKFCPQGHEYTVANTYIEQTKAGHRKRHCVACVKARAAGVDPATVSGL